MVLRMVRSSVKASGLTVDRSVFAGQSRLSCGWRGAIQASGHVYPDRETALLAGPIWPLLTRTISQRLQSSPTAKSSINQVYATHINELTYFDIYLPQFNQLGNAKARSRMTQGANRAGNAVRAS